MRFRHLTVLVLLASSACMGQSRPEPVPPPVVGKPLILLTANGRTSLSFTENQEITVELRTSSNTKSCILLYPIVEGVDAIPTKGKLTFKPSDTLYPKPGQSMKVTVSCESKDGKSAETTLIVEHQKS